MEKLDVTDRKAQETGLAGLAELPPTHTDLNGESVHAHPSLSATRTREGEDGAMVWDQEPHGMLELQYSQARLGLSTCKGLAPQNGLRLVFLYVLHCIACMSRQAQLKKCRFV